MLRCDPNALAAVDIDVSPSLKPVGTSPDVCPCLECAQVASDTTMDHLEEFIPQAPQQHELVCCRAAIEGLHKSINNSSFKYRRMKLLIISLSNWAISSDDFPRRALPRLHPSVHVG